MTSYTLKNDGYPWKTITQNRKAVGRVYREAGNYHGVIGEHRATGRTEAEAFDEVAARAFGFPDARSLRANNAQARARTAGTRALAREFVTSDFKHQLEIIDSLVKTR